MNTDIIKKGVNGVINIPYRRNPVREFDGHKFALQKDKKDIRDLKLHKIHRIENLPEDSFKVHMNKYLTHFKVGNQGNQGACGAFSYAESAQGSLITNNQTLLILAAEFIYYVARRNKNKDEGVSLRDLLKAMARHGACLEDLWPFMDASFAIKPSEEAFKDAKNRPLLRYESISQREDEIKDAIMQGYSIIYGKAVYSSFMSRNVERTGLIPMPDIHKEELYGWHAQSIWDYNRRGTDELNHWGPDWGNGGTNNTPWEFILNRRLANSFWAVTRIKS